MARFLALHSARNASICAETIQATLSPWAAWLMWPDSMEIENNAPVSRCGLPSEGKTTGRAKACHAGQILAEDSLE